MEGPLALADLTEHAVLAAVEEFDELGRETFLRKYHFGKSRGYFLEHNGSLGQQSSLSLFPLPKRKRSPMLNQRRSISRASRFKSSARKLWRLRPHPTAPQKSRSGP